MRDRFQIDEKSKEDFIISTTKWYGERLNNFTADWYGVHLEKNDNNDIISISRVPFGSEDKTENLDLIMSASCDIDDARISFNNVYELKERHEDSDKYGTPEKGGWFYQKDKAEILEQTAKFGYNPFYANLYKDGNIRVWNVSELKDKKETAINARHYTVIKDSPVIRKEGYELFNDNSTKYHRTYAETIAQQ